MKLPWIEAREESRGRRIWLSPWLPLSWIYAALAGLHRALFERGVLSRRRLPAHVISVGNLVVGGTAKTPVTAWLARGLSRRGRKVAIASRGYGRRGREPVTVVSDGKFVLGRAEQCGDEPMWLAATAAGVPVLVGRDRGVVGLRALSAFGAEWLVLDDGFQHHRLARDVDLVLFDGRFGFGNGHVLPRGPLREPARALRRAHALLVVDGPLPPSDEERLARLAPTARRFEARRRSAGVRGLAGGALAPAESLRGLAVGLLAGIARPASLRHSVEALGARVAAERFFPDHHRYRREDLAGLSELAPVWVTTEKDAVKLLSGWAAGIDLRVLAMRVEIEDPEALLDWLESRVR